MSTPTNNRALIDAARFLYKSMQFSPEIHHSLDETNYFIISGYFFAYQASKEKEYLRSALVHIQVYLESGHHRETNILLFHRVLTCLGISFSQFMSSCDMTPIMVHPTANRINSILGRWPASRHNSHKKPDVIQDILFHLEHRQAGEYHYHASQGDRPIKEFRLIIKHDMALLYDCWSYKVYSFSQQ